MSDVIKERMVRALNKVLGLSHIGEVDGLDGRGRISFQQRAVLQNDKWESIGAAKESTKLVGCKKRNIRDVIISQCNTQLVGSLRFDLAPVRQVVCDGTVKEITGRNGG